MSLGDLALTRCLLVPFRTEPRRLRLAFDVEHGLASTSGPRFRPSPWRGIRPGWSSINSVRDRQPFSEVRASALPKAREYSFEVFARSNDIISMEPYPHPHQGMPRARSLPTAAPRMARQQRRRLGHNQKNPGPAASRARYQGCNGPGRIVMRPKSLWLPDPPVPCFSPAVELPGRATCCRQPTIDGRRGIGQRYRELGSTPSMVFDAMAKPAYHTTARAAPPGNAHQQQAATLHRSRRWLPGRWAHPLPRATLRLG